MMTTPAYRCYQHKAKFVQIKSQTKKAMPAILLFSSILWLFMDWRGLLGVLFQNVHIRKSCRKSRPGWFKIQWRLNLSLSFHFDLTFLLRDHP